MPPATLGNRCQEPDKGQRLSLYALAGHPRDHVAAGLKQQGDAIGESIDVDALPHLPRTANMRSADAQTCHDPYLQTCDRARLVLKKSLAFMDIATA